MKCSFSNTSVDKVSQDIPTRRPITDRIDILSQIIPTRRLITERIDKKEGEAFFVGDLGDIIRKHKLWQKCFPRVEPFYALKCNHLPPVVKLLVDMGLSFDCASKNEIQQVLEEGAESSRIIYANPCKQESHLKYAAENNIDLMTFDNEEELLKIKRIYPTARLILRILPPAHSNIQYKFGNKFGCCPDKAYKLLQMARVLDLNVVGGSFHNGYGCQEEEAYETAIQETRNVFNDGLNIGFNMNILNIGGGFNGQKKSYDQFEKVSIAINKCLDEYFPGDAMRIIAEPGRFYVRSAFSVASNVIGKKMEHYVLHNGAQLNDTSIKYYVNDGIYGSFNGLAVLPDFSSPSTLKEDGEFGQKYDSSIWGPTCDERDLIVSDCKLPELHIGDWIYFEDMGAYTFCFSSYFNGMTKLKQYFICSEKEWTELYSDV